MKRIKWENIYLIIVIIQLIDWAFKGALSCDCIVYYTCVIVVYYTIRYFRRLEK